MLSKGMDQNRGEIKSGKVPDKGRSSVIINTVTDSKFRSPSIIRKCSMGASDNKTCEFSAPNKQSNITEYFKTANNKADVSSTNSSINIHSILARVKKNKLDQGAVFYNSVNNNTNNFFNEKAYPYLNKNGKIINCSSVRNDESNCAFTNRTEVVRKTNNYQEKHNKRLKLSITTEKQLNITDYYKIRKPNNPGTQKRATNNSNSKENTNSKNTLYTSVIPKELGNTDFNRGVLESENYLSTDSTSINSRQQDHREVNLVHLEAKRKILDIFKNVGNLNKAAAPENPNNNSLTKDNGNKSNNINTSMYIKEENISSKISEKTGREHNYRTDKVSFADFCKNITRVIKISKDNKTTNTGSLKSPILKGCGISDKDNSFFLKSYSADHMNEVRQNKGYKDFNSLPITNKEVESRRVTGNKITFDDFIKNIFNDLNNTITPPSDEKPCNDNRQFFNKAATDIERTNQHRTIKDILRGSKEYKQTPKENKTTSELTFANNSEHSDMNIPTVSLELQNNFCNVIGNLIKDYTQNDQQINGDVNKNNEEDLQVFQNYETQSQSEDYLQYYPTSIDMLKITEDVRKESNQNNTQNESLVTYKEVLIKDNSVSIANAAIKEQTINRENITKDLPNCTCPENTIADVNINDLKFVDSIELECSDKLDDLLHNEVASLSKDDNISNEKSQQIDVDKTDKLCEFLENLLKQNTEGPESNSSNKKMPQRRKIYIKKYRKGKTKIYRLKKLKKTSTKSADEPETEQLDFFDVFKKMTQEPAEQKSCLPKCKSMSSISTASSYITDETKSEILSSGSNELTSPRVRLRKGFNELSKDKSLLYCEDHWENISDYNKDEIKIKIQELFLKTLEDIQERSNSLLVLRRQTFSNCIFKDGRLQFKPMAESLKTVINSKSQRSRAKFKLILYLMKKIQTLLETDTKLTKRELYYQMKTFVSDQRVTDRALNAISCILDVGMWALNIVAQKGLVFGNLKVLLSSGETLNCNIPGTLIPPDINDIVELQSPAYFILVVEKEAIFHKLIEEDLPNRLTRPFIMITGKGFPDLNTQLFLKKLWMIMSIPVFILVDADPHGINIMLNYRFGSVNNAHVSHHLAVPNAKWLGVYPSEVVNYNLTREPLSERELKLVHHLLKTPYMECNPKIVDELKVLLDKKYKAEIEGLIKSETYLSEVYLPRKFFTHNFI